MTLALLGFLATVNPAAAAFALVRDRRGNRPMPVALGVVLAVVVLVGLAAGADTLLDALDVNLGTYRLGAGVVIAFAGIRGLVAGTVDPVEEPTSDRGLAVFVAFPTLLTPAAAALAVSIGAEDGIVPVAAGAALAATLGGLAVYLRRILQMAMAAGGVRLLGGMAGVLGVLIAVDGVRTL